MSPAQQVKNAIQDFCDPWNKRQKTFPDALTDDFVFPEGGRKEIVTSSENMWQKFPEAVFSAEQVHVKIDGDKAEAAPVVVISNGAFVMMMTAKMAKVRGTWKIKEFGTYDPPKDAPAPESFSNIFQLPPPPALSEDELPDVIEMYDPNEPVVGQQW